jgi:hypothetical protein
MSLARFASLRLGLETLEGREVPTALQVVFDYRFDNGFFNDPVRRATLEQVGRDVASRLNLTTDLTAINPSGGNSWTATTFNPANPVQQVSVPNLNVGTDQLVVFVGGGGGGGGEAGLGGFGGYSASGGQGWFDTLRSRGRPGFATWGGSMAFDPNINWNFSLAAPAAGQTDFYTVAAHELGHVLGFGVSNQWNTLVNGNQFTGANARALNGGVNPLVSLSNPGHWQQGIVAGGAGVSMQPFVQAGTRMAFGPLDYAALADIGWEVGGASPPPAAPPTVPVLPSLPATPVPTSPQLGATADPLVVGGSDGTFQMFTRVNGTLTPLGGPVTPFPGYTGPVRVATGDFDGDGVKDVAAAAGPGGSPQVRVFSGRTGQTVQSFLAYEPQFVGGMFVTAGDFNGDGRDDLVVGADAGGGPRVRVFASGNPAAVMADFWGIDDMAFRGGVRVAAGDVNGDGRADLVAAAGPGGGPRIAVYDGQTIAQNRPQKPIGDFFAYAPSVLNGAYVAVGDFSGDGFADIAFGPGSASAHLMVISGRTLLTQGATTALSQPFISNIIPQAGGYDGGLRVAAADLNADGRSMFIAATGPRTNGQLYVVGYTGQLTPTLAFGGVFQSTGLDIG